MFDSFYLVIDPEPQIIRNDDNYIVAQKFHWRLERTDSKGSLVTVSLGTAKSLKKAVKKANKAYRERIQRGYD